MFLVGKQNEDQIKANEISNDMVLQVLETVAGGRVYQLKTQNENSYQNAIPKEILANGQEIADLLKQVATHQPLSDKVKELGENRKFRFLSKDVEGVDRTAIQQNLKEKVTRALDVFRSLTLLLHSPL